MSAPLMSPELQQKMAIWRQKALTNELTLDDCKEAVALIREGRMEAAKSAASTKRAAAKKAVLTSEQMFGGLDE